MLSPTDAFRTSLSALRHAKMRSFLTMLGIVIGIASVILLMSIGTSAQKLILSQVEGIGSNLVFVIPGGSNGSKFSSPAAAQGIIIKTLTQPDVDALKREQAITGVAPEARGQARVVSESNDVSASYTGITAEAFAIRNFTIAKGYAFTGNDVQAYNRVAVLGSEIAETLFGAVSPIGKSIRLKDNGFRVVGILVSKGLGPFGVDQDNIILIPVTVAQKQLLGIDYFNSFTIQANPAFNIDFTKQRIISVLRQNHRITDPNKDDFMVHTQADAVNLLGSITGVLKIFLTAIASISLVVGGIGIMNIMLVSVIERTREIGLRKAVGATDQDIMIQFLIESMLLTFTGGLVGIIIGAGFAFVASLVLAQMTPGWVFALPLSSILLAVGVSSLTGIIFGLYPARQAARKNPIEALRYE